jgi:hypothetical protein
MPAKSDVAAGIVTLEPEDGVTVTSVSVCVIDKSTLNEEEEAEETKSPPVPEISVGVGRAVIVIA